MVADNCRWIIRKVVWMRNGSASATDESAKSSIPTREEKTVFFKFIK